MTKEEIRKKIIEAKEAPIPKDIVKENCKSYDEWAKKKGYESYAEWWKDQEML